MEKNQHESFLERAERSFEFLKATNRYDDLMAKSTPVSKGDQGYCIPLSDLHLANPHGGDYFSPLLGRDPAVGERLVLESLRAYRPTEQAYILVNQFHEQQALISVRAAIHDGVDTLFIRQLVLAENADQDLVSNQVRALAISLDETLVADAVAFESAPRNAMQDFANACGFILKGQDWKFTYNEDRLGQDEILTAGPTISALETSYALDACRYGWNSEWAKYIKKFESSFASYIGTNHALTTSSCTGALHIALKALGIGPGDEVIVPEITWVATASAVVYVGAKPVFAEVEAGNWCMDPDKLERLITPRTKCIMPVHTYGHPCDMDRIMEIARKHHLYVVEDAAPAIGAEIRGRKAGSYGHFAAFSFQGAKMLVTGEGGMLVTSDPELYKKAYAIWDHGRTPGTFWINEVGYKYKMANIQAAIGLGQLERVEPQITAKRRIANWYHEELKDFDGVKLWRESEWARSIYWMSSLTLNPNYGVTRDEFFAELKKKKIDTRPAFPAISQYPMWPTESHSTAKFIGDWGVNLPSGVLLKEHQVRYVARSIRDVMMALKR